MWSRRRAGMVKRITQKRVVASLDNWMGLLLLGVVARPMVVVSEYCDVGVFFLRILALDFLLMNMFLQVGLGYKQGGGGKVCMHLNNCFFFLSFAFPSAFLTHLLGNWMTFMCILFILMTHIFLLTY